MWCWISCLQDFLPTSFNFSLQLSETWHSICNTGTCICSGFHCTWHSKATMTSVLELTRESLVSFWGRNVFVFITYNWQKFEPIIYRGQAPCIPFKLTRLWLTSSLTRSILEVCITEWFNGKFYIFWETIRNLNQVLTIRLR